MESEVQFWGLYHIVLMRNWAQNRDSMETRPGFGYPGGMDGWYQQESGRAECEGCVHIAACKNIWQENAKF